MDEILRRQLALDYCCTEEEVENRENQFHLQRFHPGRRRFEEPEDSPLKIAVVNGKLLFAGREDLITWCRKEYGEMGGAWFLEAPNLFKIEERLRRSGCRILQVHPFFISREFSSVSTEGFDIRWFRGREEIECFRGDERFRKAYSFCEEAPDVIGVAACREGRILGMAGASADSPLMWQIGINVEPGHEGSGIATMLVRLVKNEILKQGVLPFYGTAFSHLASQRVALGSGFRLAFAELVAGKESICQES